MHMLDKRHSPCWLEHSITLSTFRGGGCPASCLWNLEAALAYGRDALAHHIPMLFPQPLVPWSMASDQDGDGGMAVELHSGI